MTGRAQAQRPWHGAQGRRAESAAVPQPADIVRRSGAALDPGVSTLMASRFGHDFAHVRVHSDPMAAASADAVDAVAYTLGEHVVLGSAAPPLEGSRGQRLLAHELAHVVQQSRRSTGPTDVSQLEVEADNAAAAVGAGSAVAALGGTTVPMVLREKKPAPTPPQPAPPSAKQQPLVDDAMRAAAIRAQVALFRVRGLVPPSPDPNADPAGEARMTARDLARRMFEWDDPNMEQVEEIVSAMVGRLTGGTQVLVAPAGDPDCGPRAAYVRGYRPPIVLCPAFFKQTPEERIRTMIHESAHLSRIGSADLSESYCVIFDCTQGCGGFDSADSWAQFVHCLSGQTPDKPITLQPGKPPTGGGGKRP